MTNTTNYRRREYDYDYDRNALDIYVSGPVTLFGREHTLLLGYNYDGLETNSGGVEAPALSNIPFGRHDLVPEFWLPYNTFSESKTTQSGFYGQVRISVIDPFTVVAGGRVSDYEAKSRR